IILGTKVETIAQGEVQPLIQPEHLTNIQKQAFLPGVGSSQLWGGNNKATTLTREGESILKINSAVGSAGRGRLLPGLSLLPWSVRNSGMIVVFALIVPSSLSVCALAALG